MPRTLHNLSPQEFENLTFDILRLSGFENLTWRTPGSDEGRDIQGVFNAVDAAGHMSMQKWYIECKRYKSSISWPTIWQKIAYADVQAADYLLISTNSTPSTQCENQISAWNQGARRPAVRVWRGYDIDGLVRVHGVLGVKYGLADPPSAFQHNFGPLSLLLSKSVQAGYSATALGLDGALALEASAALSELLTLRIHQVETLGRFVLAASAVDDGLYPWVAVGGAPMSCDFVSLRALLSYTRFVTRWPKMELLRVGAAVELGSGLSIAITPSAWRAVLQLEPWLGGQLSLNDNRTKITLAIGG